MERATYGVIGRHNLKGSVFDCLDDSSAIPTDAQIIIDTINKLSFGRFLIRGITPEDNHKQEMKGHSMAFIKSSQGDFYFDPDFGAMVLLSNTGVNVAEIIKNQEFWYSLIRIYSVACGKDGCENLAPLES